MATYRSMLELKIPSRRAASLTGVSRTTANRKPAPPKDVASVVPKNKLSAAERAGIVAALNSPEFVDLAPAQVYTKLLDEGIYLGSLSTLYRVLEENKQVKERRRLAKHPPRAVPELVATAPGQVFTWDITKLAGPVKGKYYDCYMMVDIHSRFIVGAHVHATEFGVLAVDMMKEIFSDPRHPAGRARRPGNVHDLQNRRRAALGRCGHPVSLQTPGVQRQPLHWIAVQPLNTVPSSRNASRQSTTPEHSSTASWTGTTPTTNTPK